MAELLFLDTTYQNTKSIDILKQNMDLQEKINVEQVAIAKEEVLLEVDGVKAELKEVKAELKEEKEKNQEQERKIEKLLTLIREIANRVDFVLMNVHQVNRQHDEEIEGLRRFVEEHL